MAPKDSIPDFPTGWRDFAKRLKAKTDQKVNLWNCDRCKAQIFIAGPGKISMHVFVNDNPPTYTTEGLCLNCFTTASKGKHATHTLKTLNP